MDIKKIESNKNDYLLFLSEKELQILEKVLTRGIIIAKNKNNIAMEDETYIMENLRSDILEELY